MILRPVAGGGAPPGATSGGPRPAFEVVAETQRAAGECWLIAQAEHARMAGEMAAHMEFPGLPGLTPLSPAALRGIALHDDGWQPVDEAALRSGERPPSFLHCAPEVVLGAWAGSIAAAQRDGPLAGYMVSRHFWRVGGAFGQAVAQSDPQRALLREFLREEEARQQALLEQAKLAADAAERLVDLLQFCDLLSLCLCCGAREPATLDDAAGRAVALRWRDDDGACLLEPSPLRDPVPLEAPAQRFPGGEPSTLHFVLR
jgi:hypothetical protein